jgi:MinD-like ATPase involved in chromosome partitioning or flagellar assembly
VSGPNEPAGGHPDQQDGLTGEAPTQWQQSPPAPQGPGGEQVLPGAPDPALFEEEASTDSTPHPAAGNPSVSGPHPVPPGYQPQYQQPQQQQPQQQQVPQQQPPQYRYQPAQDPNLPPLNPIYQQAHQAPPMPYGGQGGAGDDLTSAQLVRRVKRRPQSGWRKAVYVASGKLINPGESPADRRRRELIARVNQPLRGCYKIAMLSLKGGVGKTTTTTTLGSTFASLRGDRVIAVDANPDRGTLSQKLPIETTATVRHLLRDADKIRRYSDVRAYTSQGSSRLEVLASEQDPAVSEAFSENDYRRAVTLLEHFYNIVLTDCGTGLMHSAMKGVLDVADSLVIVSSASVDGARSASATLDWLDAHGYGDLVKRSVAVINSVRPKAGSVDLDKLAAHFAARTRGVCQIPFDPHLEEGAEIELDRLQPATRLALLELAATVADAFPSERRPQGM